MWKRFADDYLSYTYKERTGIFMLLGLIGLCVFIPFLYPWLITKKQYDHSKFKREIAELQLIETDSFSNKKYFSKRSGEDGFNDYATSPERNYHPGARYELFYFDPNSATPAAWRSLGIKDKTIATIQKYLSKGGHFYKPEDISKIWGLHPEEIKRLLPYVNITQKSPGYLQNEAANPVAPKQPSYIPKTVKSLDINAADTTEFIALPGIGSKLAQRIINFRNKLGGFYAVDQVGETFGLPDSTFQKIKSGLILSNQAIKKININAVLLDELKTHPYIRYAIANAIIQYRTQHGNFSLITDVKKVMLVTDEVYNKMAPYIMVTQ